MKCLWKSIHRPPLSVQHNVRWSHHFFRSSWCQIHMCIGPCSLPDNGIVDAKEDCWMMSSFSESFFKRIFCNWRTGSPFGDRKGDKYFCRSLIIPSIRWFHRLMDFFWDENVFLVNEEDESMSCTTVVHLNKSWAISGSVVWSNERKEGLWDAKDDISQITS